jgi:deoxyribodipyrimidine photolyase-related protein
MYWQYLQRHREALAKNPRMLLQIKNLKRMDLAEEDALPPSSGEQVPLQERSR